MADGKRWRATTKVCFVPKGSSLQKHRIGGFPRNILDYMTAIVRTRSQVIQYVSDVFLAKGVTGADIPL